MYNLYYVVISAAAFQGLLLALALHRVKHNKASLKWLSALLVAISVCLVGRICYDERLFAKYPKIAIGSDLILFCYGPLMLAYVKSIFLKARQKPIQIGKHFILAGLHLLWLCPFFLVSDQAVFTMLATKTHRFAGQLTEVLGWIHIAIYLTTAIQIFRKYPRKAKDFISNLPEITFLHSFFILNTLALVLWATGFFLLKFRGNTVSIFLSYNSIWLLLTGSVYIIGYYAIVFPQVFRIDTKDRNPTFNNEQQEKPQAEIIYQQIYEFKKNTVLTQKEIVNETIHAFTIETKATKTETFIVKEKSTYSEQFIKEEALKLTNFMEQEKPFLDPNLTLPMLAGKLPTTVHILSKVINESFNKNFFDYINGYRVAHFMQLAQQRDNKKFTLLALAFDSGFNSKSTFNTAFKKATNKTPSQYLKDFYLE
jgi:AraC-like DNA-binding protein